jgi:WD40 repeat protein
VRVPESAGVGAAKVTIAFDAWKDGKVAPTQHEIAIVLPRQFEFNLEAVSARLVKELIHPNKAGVLDGVHFDAAGKRIIAGDYPGGVVCVWEVESTRRTSTIETGYGYRSGLPYFFLTPDWKTLYVSRSGKNKLERVEKDGKQLNRRVYDGDIRAWDLTAGTLTRTYRHDPQRYIIFMQLAPDGSRFCTSESLPGIEDADADQRRRHVSMWDVGSGKFLDLGAGLDSYCVFAPDSRTLATARSDKDGYTTELLLLDAATGKQKLALPVKEKHGSIAVSRFSPDGKYMVVNYAIYASATDWKNFQSRLEVLQAATGKKVASLEAAPNEGVRPYFSPDGQTLAVSNWRGKESKLTLFSIPANRVHKTVVLAKENKGERLVTREPAFSADGKRLAIITQVMPDAKDPNLDPFDVPQPRIHLIDVAAGEIRTTLVAPQGFSASAAFSPDGRTLAVGGHGRVLLFDVADLDKK